MVTLDRFADNLLTSSRAVVALVVATIALLVGVLIAQPASAHVQDTRYYCTNTEVGGDTWCNGGSPANFHENRAYTYGGHCVGVRFIRVSDNAVLYRYLATNWVSSGYRDASYRWTQAANCSNIPWTISAAADYHYP